MKKIILLLVAVCLVVVLAGCQRVDSLHSANTEVPELEIIPSSKTYDFEIVRNKQIKQPTGIAVTDKNILVADSEKHCIHVLDLEGNYISSFGSLGMGNGAFFRPAGVTWSNGKIYVVDSKNCRVQVFDENYSFMKAYPLTKIDIDDPYSYIAVTDDGEIYVTATTAVSQYAHIYHIHPNDGRQSLIGNNIIGSVCASGKEALFAESRTITHESGTTVQIPGRNSLFSLNDDLMTNITEWPYKYSPVHMLVHDDSIYAFSYRHSTIDRFNSDGSYVETLFQLPEDYLSFTCYAMAYNEKDNSFILSFPEERCMMRVHETNKDE